MVGGLILSQVLTLYTTPVIYVAFDGLARRFRRRHTPGSAGARSAEGEHLGGQGKKEAR
jgi:multidrug efflux pump